MSSFDEFDAYAGNLSLITSNLEKEDWEQVENELNNFTSWLDYEPTYDKSSEKRKHQLYSVTLPRVVKLVLTKTYRKLSASKSQEVIGSFLLNLCGVPSSASPKASTGLILKLIGEGYDGVKEVLAHLLDSKTALYLKSPRKMTVVAAAATTTAVVPHIVPSLAAVAPAAPVVAPREAPVTDDAWKAEVVVGSVIDVRNKGGSWEMAFVEDKKTDSKSDIQIQVSLCMSGDTEWLSLTRSERVAAYETMTGMPVPPLVIAFAGDVSATVPAPTAPELLGEATAAINDENANPAAASPVGPETRDAWREALKVGSLMDALCMDMGGEGKWYQACVLEVRETVIAVVGVEVAAADSNDGGDDTPPLLTVASGVEASGAAIDTGMVVVAPEVEAGREGPRESLSPMVARSPLRRLDAAAGDGAVAATAIAAAAAAFGQCGRVRCDRRGDRFALSTAATTPAHAVCTQGGTCVLRGPGREHGRVAQRRRTGPSAAGYPFRWCSR